MSLVETLKRTFTSEERIVYRCESCGETFEVSETEPSCPSCGADEVRQINRV